jgi:prephenate dehydratase
MADTQTLRQEATPSMTATGYACIHFPLHESQQTTVACSSSAWVFTPVETLEVDWEVVPCSVQIST